MLKKLLDVNKINQHFPILTSGVVNFHNGLICLKKVEKRKPLKTSKKDIKVVNVWRSMTVQQLAQGFDRKIDDIYEALDIAGDENRYNHPSTSIDDGKLLQKIVKLLGGKAAFVSAPIDDTETCENKDVFRRPPPDLKLTKPRPPVVTIMGHVDHGKTTLLDSIRNSSIVDKEFGGITQHIGAFLVDVGNYLRNKSKEYICFLDTPGHAAFSAIRSRGAHITDIIVLVVAADDGIMQQTIESITLARKENVPLIVAINKIDKPTSNIEEVKERLLAYGVQLEDFGGEIQSVPISALNGDNIDKLIEAIEVQAEMMGLRSEFSGLVEGVVIESSMDIHRGKLATVIVQRGTLRKGCVLVAGTAYCKVRGLFNDLGFPVSEATPGMPVETIGWKDLPSAGDEVLQVNSEKRANEVLKYRQQKLNEEKQEKDYMAIQEKVQEHLKTYKAELLERRSQGIHRRRYTGPKTKEVDDKRLKYSLVLKGDVDGSLEAILDVLDTYHCDLIHLDLIHYGIGSITQTDIDMAALFNGTVYCFNINVPESVKSLAKQSNVLIKSYNVIYKLIDDIKDSLNQKLPMVDKEEIIGEANVLQEFLVSEGKKKVPVAGCRVTKGNLHKDALYKVIRNQDILYQGNLSSMKHLKNEVSSIKKDQECGLKVDDANIKFLPGDVFICYKMIKVPQYIDWNVGF